MNLEKCGTAIKIRTKSTYDRRIVIPADFDHAFSGGEGKGEACLFGRRRERMTLLRAARTGLMVHRMIHLSGPISVPIVSTKKLIRGVLGSASAARYCCPQQCGPFHQIGYIGRGRTAFSAVQRWHNSADELRH